jgi:hypothetical protein
VCEEGVAALRSRGILRPRWAEARPMELEELAVVWAAVAVLLGSLVLLVGV